MRDPHMAIRRARTHLRTIRREPRNLVARFEAGFRQHLTEHENTLPPESGNLDSKIQFPPVARRQAGAVVLYAENPWKVGDRRWTGRSGPRRRIFGAIAVVRGREN